MVPFFKNIEPFGDQGKDHKEPIEAIEFDAQKWIDGHREWRQRIISYVEGNTAEPIDETVLTKDDHCELGQWIHGHGHKHFNNIPVFHEVKSDHAAFHHAAGKVIGTYRSHGAAAAKKALQADFDRCSMRVISALERLEKHIKN